MTYHPVTQPHHSVHPSMSGVGLTKLEYFAGVAMQGLLSTENFSKLSDDFVARSAVQCAKALIDQLNQVEG